MNKAENELISILRYELDGSTDVTIDPNNEQLIAELYDIASKHDLAHMVGDALMELGLRLDGEYSDRFRKAQMSAIIRYEQIKAEFDRISSAFEKSGITFIPLKGAVIRKYYPRPEMRTSCDIDILVHANELERAEETLVNELSCSRVGDGSHDIRFLTLSGIVFELHFTLSDDSFGTEIKQILESVWNYAELDDGSEFRYVLDSEFAYFYHITHMIKHFEYGGCGIRTLMDLWIFEHRIDKMIKTNGLVKKCGLTEFADAVSALADKWFSGIVPDGADEILLSQMEEYISDGGIYGSVENRVKASRRDEKGKFGYIMSRLFLSYSKMKYEYPILREYSILLPFCEIHRWGRLFCGKTASRIANELKINGSVTDDANRSIKEMFAKLGLN